MKQVTGVDNVCERAARTADADGELLCPKCIREQMTVALTETEVTLQF
ncbi:MAG: cobalamin biosynthesis protein [Mediterraneibacter faecis]